MSVWGAIIHDQKPPLVLIDGRLKGQLYVENILAQHVIPYMRNERANGRIVTLQQDRAPPHTAHTTQEYLKQNGVDILDWPAISPDMNCIENLWSVLSLTCPSHKTTTNYFKSYLQRGT